MLSTHIGQCSSQTDYLHRTCSSSAQMKTEGEAIIAMRGAAVAASSPFQLSPRYLRRRDSQIAFLKIGYNSTSRMSKANLHPSTEPQTSTGVPMAKGKAKSFLIKLVSTAQTGYFYVTTKNPKNTTIKLALKKV